MALLISPLAMAQGYEAHLDTIHQGSEGEFSVRQETNGLRSVLWSQIRRIADIGTMPDVGKLDSLFLCCLKGKSGDPDFEREVQADLLFFKGCSLMYVTPERAKPMIETAIVQFRSLGDSTKTALGYMQLIWTNSNLGDSTSFANARQYANGLLPYVSDPFVIINIQTSMGVGCYDFGLYAEAASHYFHALRIIEAERTTELLAAQRDIFHNLGGVYGRIGDWNNALMYIRKAIASAKETHQDTLDHYLILARILIEKKDYVNALAALKKTQNYEFVRGNSIGMGQNAYSQATCYRQLGQPDSALFYAHKAVNLLPVSINAQYGAAALLELASCEFQSGMDTALFHAQAAYGLLERAKYTSGMVEATALLSSIYKSKGDYRQAYFYNEKKFEYQNQIERQQSTRQLAFGEFSRDNAAQQARRDAEVKAELDRQRNIRYALFAGLGVLAVMAFLLYNRYRFKKRTAQQLEAKNAEVEAARRRAEQSEAFKSRFLANMSHEIRTPLHGISGFADLLQDTSLTEKQRRWLNAIHQSSGRLRDVVNDILDLSKLEAGEVTLRQVPFSPFRVAQEVTESLQPKVDEKGIRIGIESNPNIPPAVLGDPTRLYQILTNLAGNAVKFTEKGKVTIAMDLLNEGQPETASIRFAIRDTGIGIPPERIEAVFESFQQAEDSTTAKFGGTGLGLTIARDLVRLYGSDIVVKSQVGIGSEFSFTLRLPIADVSDLEEHAQTTTGYYDQPIRVLVVDDNAFNREISEEALHKHFNQVDVTFAVNGIEAVEKAGQDTFDIILMDMQMPEMNGQEATQRIRQLSDKKGRVPIVALTASATPDEIQSALDAGMDRHLGKPFKPVELASVIATVLKLEPTSDNITNPQQDQPEKADHRDDSKYDLTFLRDFCDGDEEQMLYFLDTFFNQLPGELGRMETALRNNDFEQLQRLIHSFKPQLEFIGLKKEAITSLERKIIEGQSGDVLRELLQLPLKNNVSKTTEQS